MSRHLLLAAALLVAACGSPPPEVPTLSPPMGFETMDAPVQRQFRELEQHLAEAVESDAPDAEVAKHLGALGQWFQAYRFHESALVAYGAAVDREGDEAKWIYLLGRVRASTGDHAGATEAFRRALELEPDLSAAAVRAAESLRAQGESGEAVTELLERALELDEQCVRAMVALAEERRRGGDPDRAVDLLKKALELQQLPEIRYYLGLAYRDRGDLELAQELLAEARPGTKPEGFRMRDPYSAEAAAMDVGYVTAMKKARQDLSAGRFVVALNHYRRAMEARPEMAEARLGEVRSLFALERLQQARVKVEALLEQQPDLPKGHYLAGRIYDALEAGTGEASYRRALELDPELLPALMRLGHLSLENGEPAAALGYFARARSVAPEHLEAAVRHVRTLAAQGRLPEARAVLREAYGQVEVSGPLTVLAEELGMSVEELEGG